MLGPCRITLGHDTSNSEAGGKEAGHTLWKNDRDQGWDVEWLEPNRFKMADKMTSARLWASVYTRPAHQHAKWHTPRHHDSSEAKHQRPKTGRQPSSLKSPLLPQKSWNNPPAHLAYEITVSYKLVLAKGSCHPPLQILNSMLLQLLTLDMALRKIKMENEALCVPSKLLE